LTRRIREIDRREGRRRERGRRHGHHRERTQADDGREGQRGRAGHPDGDAGVALCFRLFAPYAHKRKVTISGSAACNPPRLNSAGVELGAQAGRSRFHGHHRRGQRDHAGRPRGGGPRKQFRREHPAALEQSANPLIQTTKNSSPSNIFLPQAHLRRHSDAMRCSPAVSARWTRLRGAHAHANGQEPVDAAGAGGQTRRHVLENVDNTSANICCATN